MFEILNYRRISALALVIVAVALIAAYSEYTRHDLINYAQIRADRKRNAISITLKFVMAEVWRVREVGQRRVG